MDALESLLEICYQDDYIVAINKPSGMLCHRSSIDPNEQVNAMHTLRDQIGKYVYPVHRLDKPTSGVLLFALNNEIARKLTETFTEREVEKNYLAIARGFTLDNDKIDYPLKKMVDKKDKHKAKANVTQDAITSYTCIKKAEIPISSGKFNTSRYSLVSVQPHTGRQRQIRRHFKHIFHPIVGDTAHGDGKHNQIFREHFNCYRLLLHAQSLTLNHPVSNAKMVIEAGLDDTFKRILNEVFRE
ncbi:tRNA pseudouridine(65) synthase TruC [Chondrinema litorale]|uniref:tRNA pseudouridine(65) synthase TruC n=1 Tax=Chondrinema litorale TaxID=2994555 RepID=UPI002543ED07|nr:tRNA pseudouridine(65) synthase TruC [Chondrinema litorale]UZR93009.1 tRNA pseudouridine(65) synthase TruC [Chondrinema litorale]